MHAKPAPFLLHASTVDIDGKGLLITGASGRGKSGLALELMAFGATLVADDRTEIYITPDGCFARAPKATAKMIEARGIGLLNARATSETKIILVVDLDQTESERLPLAHFFSIGGVDLPCIYRYSTSHFVPAILQMMRAGRCEP